MKPIFPIIGCILLALVTSLAVSAPASAAASARPRTITCPYLKTGLTFAVPAKRGDLLDVGEIGQNRAVETDVILPLAEVDDGVVAERRLAVRVGAEIKASLQPPLLGFSIGTSARGRTLCI